VGGDRRHARTGGAHVRNSLAIVLAITWRRLQHYMRNPAISVPYFMMPLLLFAFGGGGLSRLDGVPQFDFPPGYTTFYFVFILFQGAAFTGAATGGSVAADFENGFASRLMLAASHRASVVAGYVFASTCLALSLLIVLTTVALATGMNIDGSAFQMAGVYMMALLLAVAASLWGAGFALRVRITQAQSAVSMPLFLTLMLSPAFVPRPLLGEWLKAVADYNPMPAILEAARGLVSGRPDETGLAFLVIFGLIAVFTVWSVTGLRSALNST
jgi:ABC-2 type transport system permease protein